MTEPTNPYLNKDRDIDRHTASGGPLTNPTMPYTVGRSLIVGGVATTLVWVVSWIIPIPLVIGGVAAGLWGLYEHHRDKDSKQ